MPSGKMGTTAECLEHFAKSYPTDDTRPVLAEFCGVINPTAGRWLNGRNLPSGDELIRLMVFLQLAGNRVSELDKVPRTYRQLAQVIAVGILGPDEVKKKLGYRNTQDVYRLLRGGGLLKDKQLKLKLLLDETQEELNGKLASWKARIEDLIGEPSAKSRRSSQPPEPTVEQAVVAIAPMAQTSVEVIDHLVAALSAALDTGTSPEEQIALIRETVDPFRLRKLVSQLEALSAE